jgi:hypothetical protein
MTPSCQPSNIPVGNSGTRYRPQLEETTITWHGSHGYLLDHPQVVADPLDRKPQIGQAVHG